MFGYIKTQPFALTKEEKVRYKAFYCGLCDNLEKKYGTAGTMALSFDMTFLTMLLSSLYAMPETTGERRCLAHPMAKHPFVVTEATEYGADLNLFLAYYKNLDDWQDERKAAARERARKQEAYVASLRQSWPRQCEAVEKGIAQLAVMEKENELNPDLPTNCFGEMMGELFVYKEDDYAKDLRQMGAALGRFVYLLDASNDLKTDIKKELYNPLMGQMDTDFLPLLTLMMGDCTEAFERLPISQDVRILRNVLYAGVWTMYKKRDRNEGAKE
jgi:hypothetical protein